MMLFYFYKIKNTLLFLKKYFIGYLIFLLIVFFLSTYFVKADTITDYKYQFKWFEYDLTNEKDVQNGWTSYHPPSDNYSLLLYGKEDYSPTYDLFQYMSGFDTTINRSISKGVSYTTTVNFSFSSISDSEFQSSRLSKFTDSSNVRISNSTYTYGSYSYSKYNCFTYLSVNYCTYNLSVSYSFVATSDASSFQLGSWVSSGAGYAFFQHYLTSAYNLTSINIEKNADNTIINQNQTIIDQNQQIIDNNNKTNEELEKNTEEQKKTNDTLTDSDTSSATEEGSSFFNDFTTTDHGGISSIVTAPLTAINAMLESSCTSLSATWKGKTIELPCGYDFWGKMGEIKSFLNVAIGGLLCYRIILKMYLLIEKLKNPDNDRVEVMNL